MNYFSEKERGLRPRTEEKITHSAWGGIVAIIQSLISSGAFGKEFRETCPDGTAVVGTDSQAFTLVAKAEIPNIEWPLQTTIQSSGGFLGDKEAYVPDTLDILDLIEFCYRIVVKPIEGGYHSSYQHHHLSFDIQTGRDEFREKINRIFSRSGLAYELDEDGSIVRLAPPILREILYSASFNTGDSTLDEMLEDSITKYLNPAPQVRYEAVERLWDSWERIKTLEDPNNKKKSVSTLLDKASDEKNFRALLDEEARKLTEIGNTFHIRHSEQNQTKLLISDHIDYLFHRLFSIIQLLLKARNG